MRSTDLLLRQAVLHTQPTLGPFVRDVVHSLTLIIHKPYGHILVKLSDISRLDNKYTCS